MPKKPYSTSAVVTLNLSRPIFPILQKKLQAYLDILTLSALGARCMRSALETRMFFQDSRKKCKLILFLGAFYTQRSLHGFPCLALACFPALDTRCMFSRARQPLYVFPRYALVLCFPALDTHWIVSRAWYPWCIFPRLALESFTALDTRFMCLCSDWSVLITLVTRYWKKRQHGSAMASLVTVPLLASINTANRVMWSQAQVVVVLFVREETTLHPSVDQPLLWSPERFRNTHILLFLATVT